MEEKFDDRIGQHLKDRGFKLCDFEAMPVKVKPGEMQQFVPDKGIVTFKLTNRRRQTHDNRISYKAFWDNKTGIVYGQPLGFGVSEKQRSLRWKEIFIAGELALDLADIDQRKQYYVLIHSEILKGGVNANSQAYLQLENPELEARNRNATRSAAIKADQLIDALKGEELVDFGMIFKISPRNTEAVIKNKLFEISQNTPGEIIKRYEDPDRKIRTILQGALANAVVTKTQQGILFGGVNLGLTEDVAVEFLKKNMNILSSVSQGVDQALGRAIVPLDPPKELKVVKEKKTAEEPVGLTKTS